MPNIVVLASGNGSNFEAIARAFQGTDIKVAMLISNRENAYVLQRAKNLGIPYRVIKGKDKFKTLYEIVSLENPDLIVLAGFMRILPPWFVGKHRYKIVNIHPSLLPAFPGKDAIRQAYDYGVKVTGITIHFVDEGVDTGPIIFQYPLLIDSGWNLDTLEEHIHRLEHRYYPCVICLLLHSPYQINGRKVLVQGEGDACEYICGGKGKGY